jgi:hypothetical protein
MIGARNVLEAYAHQHQKEHCENRFVQVDFERNMNCSFMVS